MTPKKKAAPTRQAKAKAMDDRAEHNAKADAQKERSEKLVDATSVPITSGMSVDDLVASLQDHTGKNLRLEIFYQTVDGPTGFPVPEQVVAAVIE